MEALKYNKKLIKAGLAEPEAEAIMNVLDDTFKNVLLTKDEFRSFEEKNNHRFDSLRKDNKLEIHEIKHDLEKRLIIYMGTGAATIVGILSGLQIYLAKF